MDRNELNVLKEVCEECKNTLDNGKTWECFCIYEWAVKSFVSVAYGGIDFDSNFELHRTNTVFGPEISVKKK